jgi:hypothetical protein
MTLLQSSIGVITPCQQHSEPYMAPANATSLYFQQLSLRSILSTWAVVLSFALLTCPSHAAWQGKLRLVPGAYNPSFVAHGGQYVVAARLSTPARPVVKGGLDLVEVTNSVVLCHSSRSGGDVRAAYICSLWDPWRGTFQECECVACPPARLPLRILCCD